MNFTEDVVQYQSDEFWQNNEVDLFLSPHFDEKEKQILRQRVESFRAAETLREGYIALTTSGTTQTSSSIVEKKIILTPKSALRSAAQIVLNHYQLKNEAWILNLPIYHIGGLSILARASLMKVPVIRWMDWDPERFLREVQKQSHAVLVSLVPTQIYDLLQCASSCPAQIQKVFVGGGQLNPALFSQAKERGWPLIQTFGMTETSAMIADFDEGSQCFLPFAGVQIKRDEEGLLNVKTPGLFRYELTTSHVRSQSPQDYFRTDDLIEMTSNGGFRLLGRVQNQVKILGELVSLQAVEQKIFQQLNLHDLQAAVIALPDSRRENKLILCLEESVTGTKEFWLGELQKYNKSAIGFERVDDVVQINVFPRTDLGKLHRGRLKEHLLSLR